MEPGRLPTLSLLLALRYLGWQRDSLAELHLQSWAARRYDSGATVRNSIVQTRHMADTKNTNVEQTEDVEVEVDIKDEDSGAETEEQEAEDSGAKTEADESDSDDAPVTKSKTKKVKVEKKTSEIDSQVTALSAALIRTTNELVLKLIDLQVANKLLAKAGKSKKLWSKLLGETPFLMKTGTKKPRKAVTPENMCGFKMGVDSKGADRTCKKAAMKGKHHCCMKKHWPAADQAQFSTCEALKKNGETCGAFIKKDQTTCKRHTVPK